MEATYIDRKEGVIYNLVITERETFMKQAGVLWKLRKRGNSAGSTFTALFIPMGSGSTG